MKRIFLVAALGCCSLSADSLLAQTPVSPPQAGEVLENLDVIFLLNGQQRTGIIIGADADFFRIRVRLRPDQPAATIGIPVADVERLEFAEDEERLRFIRSLLDTPDAPATADINQAAGYWGESQRFLPYRRSRAASMGIHYAELLRRSENLGHRERALEIFTKVESDAWSPEDRAAAKQGRLRAMISTGRAEAAVREAKELAAASEDPAVLIEAKYILATAADSDLRKLEEENPRWSEDIFVRPERERLYNEALDLYLYPFLFYGSEIEPSSRGLWGAVKIYNFGGNKTSAIDAAKDIISIYPKTSYAKEAATFLAANPEESPTQTHE